MAVKGLSYQEVVNAIDKIIQQQDKPSINKIRQLIGYGSLTTISKYFKQWKESDSIQTALQLQTQASYDTDNPDSKSASKRKDTMNPTINNKQGQNKQMAEINDPIVQSLIASSAELSHDILNSMSEEWNIILHEPNEEIKLKKLYAALVKEQIRRETAEKISKEAKNYADTMKAQATQRISDVRDSLEGQIAFLNGQIRQLKRESEASLDHYRDQLEKANTHLAELKNKS